MTSAQSLPHPGRSWASGWKISANALCQFLDLSFSNCGYLEQGRRGGSVTYRSWATQNMCAVPILWSHQDLGCESLDHPISSSLSHSPPFHSLWLVLSPSSPQVLVLCPCTLETLDQSWINQPFLCLSFPPVAQDEESLTLVMNGIQTHTYV